MTNDFLKPILDRISKMLDEMKAKPVVTADESKPTKAPEAAPPSTEPRWLALARAEIGVEEIKGAKHNQTILGYGKDAKIADYSADEIPWCAWFAGAMLERSNIVGTHSATAISYEKWGDAEPKGVYRPGAIIVLDLIATKDWRRHVGFVVGESETHVLVRGGNQSDQVGDNWFPKSKVTAVRWPVNTPKVGPDKVLIKPGDLKRVSDR